MEWMNEGLSKLMEGRWIGWWVDGYRHGWVEKRFCGSVSRWRVG